MTTIFVAWVVFPLVICILSLGCGLLLEQASGFRLSGTLVLPAGFAVLILVAQLATISPGTARLGVPVVVSLAALGFMLSFPWRGRRPDTWVLVAGVGVFAAYAAPVVLSGEATFAGFIKLDDVSTFLAMTDRVMDHGRSLNGLEFSSYLATLQTNVAIGYPLATFMPLGVGHKLLGTDSAWLFQPCMALMAAMLSVSLYALTARMAAPRALRALAAFAGGQAALLFGYALWGGIKELATAWTLPLIAALVPTVARAVERPRAVLPLAAASAVPLGVLGPGGAIWIAPALVAALVVALRAGTLRTAFRAAAVFVGCFVVMALPTIVSARDFLSSGIVDFDPIANLLNPLNPAQVLGIWPVGDFRLDPPHAGPVAVVLVVIAAAAAFGVFSAWRRGTWELSLFVVGALASCFLIYAFATPWIDAKALATAAPALPFAAVVCAVPLWQSGRRVEGGVLLSAVVAGILFSNVLQYHDAWLAPRAQLAELERIGDEFAGDGPALMTEYMPYGARHFLRRLDGEGASELRIRPVELRGGDTLPKGFYADLDDFRLDSLLVYRTLVLRRSPLESRPPSEYQLVWRGRFYEVWQRPESSTGTILEHRALSGDLQPAARPSCADVVRLAGLAGDGGQLATVLRPRAIVVPLTNGSVPPGWGSDRSGSVVPAVAGTIAVEADLPRGGRYGIWLGGSVRDRVELSVDGKRVADTRNQLNTAGQYTHLAELDLDAGRHTFSLHYTGPDLRPGSGGPQFPMGPLALGQTTADVPVTYVPTAKARTLCGRNLDWIEALSG